MQQIKKLHEIKSILDPEYTLATHQIKNNLILKFHYKKVNSTQLQARKIHDYIQKDEILILQADHQTEGIGQYDRKWICTNGKDLLVTYCMGFDRSMINKINFISQTIGLAIINSLEQYGILGKIKWVNDVCVNQKKIAGILSDSFIFEDKIVVLIGIGINVNSNKQDLNHIPNPCTSIFIEKQIKQEINIQDLMINISTWVLNCIKKLVQMGFEEILKDLSKKIENFGNKNIQFRQIDNKVITGKINGINNQGQILIQTEEKILAYNNGQIEKILY